MKKIIVLILCLFSFLAFAQGDKELSFENERVLFKVYEKNNSIFYTCTVKKTGKLKKDNEILLSTDINERILSMGRRKGSKKNSRLFTVVTNEYEMVYIFRDDGDIWMFTKTKIADE